MSRIADQLGLRLLRVICPLLAHDWTFRNIAADGRCTACCRVCGKCEPAQLLVRSHPAEPGYPPASGTAPAVARPAANAETPEVAA